MSIVHDPIIQILISPTKPVVGVMLCCKFYIISNVGRNVQFRNSGSVVGLLVGSRKNFVVALLLLRSLKEANILKVVNEVNFGRRRRRCRRSSRIA